MVSHLINRTIFISLLFWAICLLPCHSLAADKKFSEADIKVAYLYNFLRFVEWPETEPIENHICIIGVKDEYTSTFETLRQQKIKNEKLKIKVYGKGQYSENLKNCQLIFITSMEKYPEEIINKIKDTPVLSVGESKKFAKQGGMINFVKKRDRIKFDINLNAVNHTKLRITSKILRIANSVKQ